MTTAVAVGAAVAAGVGAAVAVEAGGAAGVVRGTDCAGWLGAPPHDTSSRADEMQTTA
jgi:hypothetical protein